ncbi:hypothetical protein ACFRAO_39995 [Streptomyces sp. NPDC056656]|uniref:hypothetical protein n=1 Tax=Streptomyces sp. NPDC056656 TaxID=3345895 RepID=UPI0036960D49
MSWQHPQNGDDGPRIYGVYDAEATAGAYDQYDDPAAAHGWYEQHQAHAPGPGYAEQPYGDPAYTHPAYADGADDLISTAPLATIGVPDAPEDSAIFVDGSGRRRRHMRRAAIGIGAGCVVFLGVVIAGLFGSGPSGGPLPWGHKDDTKAPRAEHSPSSSPTARPGDSAQPGDPGATGPASSASPSSTKGDGEPTGKTASEPATSSAPRSSAPTTTAPSATAPAKGNATDNPGRGHGRGSTKGPN